jgi:hypothetical protein
MQLDVASRALLMKILEDATQEAVRRQAKVTMHFNCRRPHLHSTYFSGQNANANQI